MDMYKTIWACPYCGELHLELSEPHICHHCGFLTPGRTDPEYEKLEKSTKLIAYRRIVKHLKGGRKKSGKGK
jgi:hypothetical protein